VEVGVGDGKGVGVAAVSAVPSPVVSKWRKPTKAASRMSRGQRMAILGLGRNLSHRKYLVKRSIVLRRSSPEFAVS